MNSVLEQLTQTIEARSHADPSTSYVAKLLHKGEDAILKKVGEEATELVMASKDGERTKIIYECADLWFHTLVLLKHHHLTAAEVLAELARREGVSGIVEKASRKDQI